MFSKLKYFPMIGLLFLGACTEEDDPKEMLGETAVEDGISAKETAASSIEIESMARSRSISLGEAFNRLKWQRKAPLLEKRATSLLNDDFGGVWIDVNDNDRVKLAVVDNTQLSDTRRSNLRLDLRRIFTELDLQDAADVVTVERSFAELKAANTEIGDAISNIGPENRIVAGLKTDLNAVRLGIPVGASLTESEQRLIDTAMDTYGNGVIIDEYVGHVQTQADCAYPYCNPELRGGNRIHNSGRYCTNAFVAQSKVDDKMYQFTAGHCAAGGYDDTWYTYFTNGSAHNIGSVHNYTFGTGGDMAIIRISNVSGWDPENWVHVTASSDTTVNETYTITSEGSSTVGMRICITGSAYGHSDCGTVTDVGVTVTYSAEGVTVKNLGRANYCSIPGDSGAPLYASHTAYGIHSGGVTGTCDAFYQGIKGAEKLMNVNVIH